MSIVVENLSKHFGEQKAVNEISFEAKPGDILGFLGPNGAGKSTTMKIITCYLPPASGKASVCGHDVVKSPLQVRRKVGYLPEHNPLYLEMYVHEYLRFIASLYGIKGSKAVIRAKEMIALVGLQLEQNKQIGALSKGYRQRVGLAQALIHDPEVLILDEPTTGLDPNQIQEIRSVIKNISYNKTVVFSTHIMQEVQALCDRVIIIKRGVLVANEPVASLKAGTGGTQVLVELEAPADITCFGQIAGAGQVIQQSATRFKVLASGERDIRGDIFRMAAGRGMAIISMGLQEKSLEAVFQDLTR